MNKRRSLSMKHLFPILGSLAAVVLLFPIIADSAEDDYVVIVHKQSSVSSLTKSALGELYLKKTTRWKNGVEVDPIDLAAGNPVRARFSQEILARNVNAIQAHWRKAIFAGKGVPPIELVHDGDVLNYVSNHPGAIGYVSADTYMEAANVRKVKVTDAK